MTSSSRSTSHTGEGSEIGLVNVHHHNHLALTDETMSATINFDAPKGFKFMLLDILCGSISGIVNHCVGHPIE